MLALAMLMITGCTINRDIMFKTPRDYAFDTIPDTVGRQFKIQPDDNLSFRLFANDGFKMIDLVDERQQANLNYNRVQFNYIVDPDGTTKLPVIGKVHLAGLTVRQAEMLLEERYSTYYQKPFVLLTVGNRRVVVFPGGGGDAKIVSLENNNTTLLEVLASAGGIANRGDAHRVKLFRRKENGGREVYQFNLSEIEGLKYGDIVMQADDVVYVQPNPEIAQGILHEITPLVTLLTTAILVLGVVQSLSK